MTGPASHIPVVRIGLSLDEAELLQPALAPFAEMLAITEQQGRCELVFYPGDTARASALARELTALLAELLPARAVAVTQDVIRAEDWRESWKESFRPVRISDRTVVVPPWHEPAADSPPNLLRIHPGMSFGTGQHFTTQSCLALIEDCILQHRVDAFLDIGCGSGVLAILAARLGVPQVDAIDIDPECIRCTRENMALNHTPAIHVHEAAAEDWAPSRRYGLVCANMLSSELRRAFAAICRCVAPHGRLVLGGLLAGEADAMAATAAAHGLQPATARSDGTWTTLLFTAAEPPSP